MRRIVTLLNQIAETSVNTAGLQAQMENAFKTAEKHQEDNQILKTVRVSDRKLKKNSISWMLFLFWSKVLQKDFVIYNWTEIIFL